MFIQTEATPNPATLKFLPGRSVGGARTHQFADPKAATGSPLAQRLFAVDDIQAVFLGPDCVTVTKSPGADWSTIKPAVLGAIMEHFVTGEPLFDTETTDSGHTAATGDSELVNQIKELLDTRVRPAVAQDGGDITFSGFREGIVYLHMRGACAGCPSSTATLRHGIENLLKHFCPDVQAVQSV